MKTMLFRLASAVAISAALTSVANATHFDNFFAVQLDFGPGLTQYARLSDTFSGKAGDTFTDEYLFYVPPISDDVDLTFSADKIHNHISVAFTDVALYPYQPGSFVSSIPLSLTGDSSYLTGSTVSPIDVGNYLIEVSGTLLSADASYGGSVFATISTVPEPSTWAMLLTGLAATGWYGLRRKQRADGGR